MIRERKTGAGGMMAAFASPDRRELTVLHGYGQHIGQHRLTLPIDPSLTLAALDQVIDAGFAAMEAAMAAARAALPAPEPDEWG